MDRIRSLDVTSLDITDEGVKGFAWPVSWREHGIFRDQFMTAYAAEVRTLIANGNEDGELLAILAMEFVQEALRGWFAAVLLGRFARRGEQITARWLRSNHTDDAQFWQPQRDRIGFLRGRFPASHWRALLRPVYGLLQDDGLSWRWPETVDFRNRIIATNPCPLTREHARQIGEKPVLVSLRYWFGEASDTLPADLRPYQLQPTTIDAILNGFVNAARSAGDALPESLLVHMRAWLNEAAPVCRWYLQSLAKHPNRLPAQLWTGSGGYIFRRILHTAVRRVGGKCLSHDHGSGIGLFDAPDANLTEFVTPDAFITFSAVQAEGYRTQRRESFRMQDHWPQIDFIQANKRPGSLPPPAHDGPMRNILFVANQYRGEKMTITPIEFDTVAVDWQARLFSQLKRLGYNVLFRAHPDSPSAAPTAFTQELGVSAATGSFAEALASADMVIMDYLHTTVLRDILFSGKPVITFEFGHCPPNAVAADLLSQRIRFVPGWYDDDNRAHTDWDRLPAMLVDAQAISRNTSFAPLFQPTEGNAP
ncbi:hypothetical protein [Ferrovibrio terrae]|uniref:hypothetical protein n=1 Tax=Ferrovibrio terrae TaxID=2594003 RepID=UPI003137EC8D